MANIDQLMPNNFLKNKSIHVLDYACSAKHTSVFLEIFLINWKCYVCIVYTFLHLLSIIYFINEGTLFLYIFV